MHFLHIWLIQSIYLHISCIFLAYYLQYLHIFSIYLHITCLFRHMSGIFHAYFLHIWLIQSMYLHIICIFKAYIYFHWMQCAYLRIFLAYFVYIFSYLTNTACIYFKHIFTYNCIFFAYLCIFLPDPFQLAWLLFNIYWTDWPWKA